MFFNNLMFYPGLVEDVGYQKKLSLYLLTSRQGCV